MHPVKIILALILFLLSVTPSLAQEPIIYLPILFKEPADMISKSTIGLVVPSAGKNNVLNPSGEIAGNHSAQGSATVSRVTTTQKYGLYSYSVISTGIGDGLNLTLLALETSANYAMFRVNNPQAARFNVTIGSATKEALFIESIDRDWSLYAIIFTATESSGQTNLRITQLDSGTKTFYIDGAHVQPVASDFSGKPTFIDGTQEGCRWLGAPHASASIRSADSRAGGLVKSFWEGYGFFPEKAVGMGTNVEELNIDSYMFLPGGELNSSKIPVREFSIIGYFLGDTLEELHEQAQALELVLALGTYPGNQPVRLRYFGAAVQKEISANYSGGLEGDLPIFYDDDVSQQDGKWVKNEKFKMQASINFAALDPFWYEVGESSTLLGTNDTATLRYIAGRLTSTGQWSNLGVTVNPSNAFGDVLTIVVSPFDGKVYIGGNFEDWNGNAGMDFIAAYDPINEDWEYVGSAGDFNDAVIVLAFGPDGTLYAGGSFLNVAGNASADVFARKPPGLGWTNLGAPAVIDAVTAITIAPNGDIYIGGRFINFAGIADADRIAYYDISAGAWSAVIAGASDEVRSIVWLPDMSLAYFGGEFANWGDANGDFIVSWDGSALSSLLTGAEDDVLSMVLAPNGVLYLGGLFISLGGVSANAAGLWNGQGFQALGVGVGSPGDVEKMTLGPDGMLYMVGQFESAGDLSIAQSATKWNGYTYAHLDIDLPGAAGSTVVWAVAVGPADSIITKNYDLFLGFDTSGTGAFAGTEIVQNQGTTSVFPKIIFNRSGGTGALLETVRNERTGRELLFNYNLLDGESLTIDLNPSNRTIVSSFFGDRMDARLANDDFSVWQLLPGDNNVSSFVVESGSPTVVGYILYREPYKSWN